MTGAVITVPVLFSDSQIDAVRKAIELAGLDLKYLLPEPIAAAISYSQVEKKILADSKILIFNYGGS